MTPPPEVPFPLPPGLRFAIFREARTPVMVISHERSGTHFLMNSIARGYGYVSAPWLSFDYDQMPINYYDPLSIAGCLETIAGHRIASTIKSHHEAAFFDGILDRVLERYVIFYIHRDPIDVMLSLWRFIHRWPWHEGPKRDDPIAFAAAEPEGHLMRYQMHQRRSMLDRWARHVEGWHSASQGRPRLRLVSYSALRDDYAATVRSFGDLLGREPADLTPPAKDKNVIPGGSVAQTPDVGALRAAVTAEAGATMRLLTGS